MIRFARSSWRCWYPFEIKAMYDPVREEFPRYLYFSSGRSGKRSIVIAFLRFR